MTRIRWDLNLVPDDFTVFYYDRVEDAIKSAPFDARNDSVAGREESFVFAIPEHRIMAFNYKQRTVWDKETKLDCICGSMNGNGETIDTVQKNYDVWKQTEDDKRDANQLRQADLVDQIEGMVGEDAIVPLWEVLVLGLGSSVDPLEEESGGGTKTTGLVDGIVEDDVVEQCVESIMTVCRVSSTMDMDRVDDGNANNENQGSSSSSITTTAQPTPMNLDALELISNLIALLPDEDLSERILLGIEQTMTPNSRAGLLRRQLTTTSSSSPSSNKGFNNNSKNNNQNSQFKTLDEDTLTEKFVRGSGAGGQKINKTANKVLLIHDPTGIRVECQDTRSLQQNRKIARKRLGLKLDDYYNGANSKVQVKAAKVVGKKAKAKARNKARRRKKEEGKAKE